MVFIRILQAPGLLTRCQIALGLTQRTLGEQLGVSRRTMGRWVAGDNGPDIQQWADLARRVHRADPALAATIAAEMGETLVTLGIVAAPPPAAAVAATPPHPAVPMSDLVDSIVCAAAEATATTPQFIRPALLAAFDRAASVSLSVADVRATLRPAAEKTAGKKKGAA